MDFKRSTKANQEAAVRGAGEMLLLELESAQTGSGPQTRSCGTGPDGQ